MLNLNFEVRKIYKMCISISNVKRYGMDYLPDSYFVFVFFRLSFLYGGVRLKKGK